ncbi:insulin receptor substrate 2-like [Psammomys obesus]|uniref:insulin receptor substrate 2-like n=1 Tax=Psammomys obesus TaxID=48139 RepID=UPI002452BD94|nr:insulin receptor substrate 2-like [Psammomys obesus]
MAAAGSGPAAPPLPGPCPPDVRLCGHLRKQKSQRRRFFVLRADPPRLECYESEKKFLAGGCRPPRPRRTVSLEGACTISKRADARQRHLIVLYTSDSSLGVAAASEAEQQAWYSALLEVRAAAAAATAAAMGEGPGRHGLGAAPSRGAPGADYLAVGVRDDYVHMGAEAGDYMWMAPPDPAPPRQDGDSAEYVPMSRLLPGPFRCELGAERGRRGARRSLRDRPAELGDYMFIPDCAGSGAPSGALDSCLNYVDLDLVPPLEVPGAAPGSSAHSYASIKF